MLRSLSQCMVSLKPCPLRYSINAFEDAPGGNLARRRFANSGDVASWTGGSNFVGGHPPLAHDPCPAVTPRSTGGVAGVSVAQPPADNASQARTANRAREELVIPKT